MKQSFSGEIDRFGAVSNMTNPLMTWTPALAGLIRARRLGRRLESALTYVKSKRIKIVSLIASKGRPLRGVPTKDRYASLFNRRGSLASLPWCQERGYWRMASVRLRYLPVWEMASPAAIDLYQSPPPSFGGSSP
jgi:hypothetical protein